MFSRYFPKATFGVLGPAVDALRHRIENEVTCNHLSLAKATLLSFVPALVPSRGNRSVALAMAQQSTMVVITLSNLIGTAKETPQLVELILKLETTLKIIYAFINSETQNSTSSSEDEVFLRSLTLTEQLASLLGDFERCITSTPRPDLTNTSVNDLEDSVIEGSATEASDDHGSVSFFSNARDFMINGGTFYSIKNESPRVVKTLRMVENHTETFDRRMERLEGNQQAMMSLIQTFMGSPQILTAVSMGFIYLMDATGCRHPVPRTMALSFEQFNEAIRVLFRPNTLRGKTLRRFMDVGAYDLSIEDDIQVRPVANEDDWSIIVPDTMIVMNIVIVQPPVEEASSRRRCSFCMSWNDIKAGSGWSAIDCYKCHRRLQSRADDVQYQERSSFANEELELIRNIHVKSQIARNYLDTHSTQPRKYITSSSTSRKDLPAVFADRRSQSQAAFNDEVSVDLPPNPTEKDLIEHKRRQNTLAARRSRQRKLEHIQTLEKERDEERKLREMWEERANELLQAIKSMGVHYEPLQSNSTTDATQDIRDFLHNSASRTSSTVQS